MNFLQRLKAKLILLFSGKRGIWRSMALTAVALMILAAPAAVRAGECGLGSPQFCIAMIFVWIFQILTSLMGFILIMEVDALIRVAQYFNFVSPGPTAVQVGWVVTRDLANMFFIVFLMIIAFSTVIGYSKYHYEQTLKKLLIMAVVINFSKTICGLMIDISQVVMLSFVNGFRAAAAGNFMNAFQINKLLRLGDGAQGYDFGLVLAMMLAFILAAIAVCVVLVMLVMLVFRVIMLWVLIILSPIAFLTAAFPLSGNYYAQWWGELKKYLIGGPVIAFFLWLALATAQATGGNLSSAQEGWGVQSSASAQEVQSQADRLELNKPQIPSEAGRTDTILSMVIITCIMFAGLKFASDPSISGLASGFAKNVTDRTKGYLKTAMRLPDRTATAALGYGYGRGKEGLMRYGGGLLAKAPVIGALGRRFALSGEEMKKSRLAGRDKAFGGLEDMARLSPKAFTRRMNSLSSSGKLDNVDKQRLNTMIGIGLKNPKIASEMFASGGGHKALDTMIQQSEGKALQDVIGTGMSDKNASSWIKGDPDLLARTYQKLQDEAQRDPNLKKTVTEFEQKFAVPLHKNGLFGNIPSVVKDKLKELVPKMSADDFKDVPGADMGTFMPHMTGKQFRDLVADGKGEQKLGMSSELAKMPKDKAFEFMRERGLNATDVPDSWYSNPNVAEFVLATTAGKADARGKIMADPTRATALRDAANRGLKGPNAPTDDNKRAAAAVQAMSVGALKVSDLDDDLLGVLSRSGDTAAIARGIDKDDPDQLAVGREVFKAILAQDPARVRNLSKNDLYNKLLPSKQEIDSAVAAQAAGVAQEKSRQRTAVNAGLADEAITVQADLSGQVQALKDAIAAGLAAKQPVDAKQQQLERLEKSMSALAAATEKRLGAEKELSQEMDRLAKAKSSGGNTADLERAIESLKKGIGEMEALQAKQVADIKGIKLDEGGRKNRGGGGRSV